MDIQASGNFLNDVLDASELYSHTLLNDLRLPTSKAVFLPEII